MPILHHFHFKQHPFEREIATEFLFESASSKEALARLLYSCQKRALAVLTGEIGSGKSTLMRHLKKRLDQNRYILLYIADSQITARDFYPLVLSALGLPIPGRLIKSKRLFREFMIDLYESKQKTCVIAIDEAQSMEHSMLNELRFIMNFDIDSYSPIALLLIGESQLKSVLRAPYMGAVWRRVETFYHLAGMTSEESKAYINHHINAAGCDHPLFPDDVIAKIHEHSRGLPAAINKLCRGCLQDAASRKQSLVSTENLTRVITEWE